MLHVQQQYFLHAHSSMSVDLLAVANLGTQHINIPMYITILKLSESCHDRTIHYFATICQLTVIRVLVDC